MKKILNKIRKIISWVLATRPRKITAAVLVILLIFTPLSFLLFNKKSSAAWWNDQWLYRKALVINQTYVTADLTDFPVLVSHTDSGYATKIQTDADDIVFTDNIGNKLSHEIESYNSGTGALVAWVKIPALDGDNNTTLYMYYGNATAGSQQDKENVWDENYVGVWHMDTAAAEDSSRYQNNTSSADYPSTYASGKINGALDFNGTTDYLNMAEDASLNDLTTITTSAWVYLDGWGENGSGRIFEKGDTNWIMYVNNASRIYWSDYRRDVPGSWYASLSSGAWRYVSITFDYSSANNNPIIYVDGSSVSVTEGGTPSGNLNAETEALNIGNNVAGDRTFDGRIEEARISKVIRSSSWIATEYNNQNSPSTFFSTNSEEVGPGPIGYWNFDEGYGTTAHDVSGQGNDGTITDASWGTESQCISGKCLFFDGSGEQVNIGNPTNLSLSSNFTISAWATSYFWSGYSSGVMAKGATTGTTVALRADHGAGCTNRGFVFRLNDGTDNAEGCGDDQSANQWYYVTMVVGERGPHGLLGYVNGVLVEDIDTTAIGSVINSSNWYIGYEERNNNYFQGFIDEVKMYPYARTPQQILKDYAGGQAAAKSSEGVAASFGSQTDKWLSDGLIGHWKMNEAVGAWDSDSTADDAFDYSISRGNGSAYGNADTVAVGKYGNAGGFDGAGDYIQVGGLLGQPSSLTLSTWVNLTSADTSGAQVFSLGDYAGILIDHPTNHFQGYFYDGTDWRGTSYGSNYAGTGWHNFIYVIDNVKHIQTIFVDGVEVAETNYSGSISYSGLGSDTHIGKHYNLSTRDMNGKIDEVRAYNRALSKDEVAKLYSWAPGPVAHWKMDEKVAGNAQTLNDTSGDENNGTTDDGANNTGMSCAVPGKYGTGCEFDGTDDGVTVGSQTVFDNMGPLTWSAWIKPDDVTNEHQVIAKMHTDYTGRQFGIGDNGKITFWMWRPSADYFRILSVANTAVVSVWQHILVTWDGDSTHPAKLYYNGQEVEYSSTAVGSGTITDDSSLNLMIGSRASGDALFDGQIDDVQIFNYALNSKQVMNVMNARDAGDEAVGSPVGSTALHLPFDEGYGDTAHDKSINSNDGTLTPGSSGGNTTVSAMWDNGGKFGKAMEFDGTDDYIILTNTITLTTQASYSFWVKPSGSGYRTVIGENVNDVASQITSSNTIGLGDSGARITSVGTVPNNQWSHVVFTVSGTSAKVFINGALDNSGTANMIDVKTIGIDHTAAADEFYSGNIDDVKIYPFALTEGEIKTDFNKGAAAVMGDDQSRNNNGTAVTGKAKDYCIPGDTAPCSAPVGEWKMDELAGTTAYDTSGNGYNGSLGGGNSSYYPAWSGLGKKGNALNFDGTNDYVDMGNTSAFDFGTTNSFTLSVWFNTNDISAGPRLINNGYSGNTNGFRYQMESTGTKLAAGLAGGGTVGTALDIDVSGYIDGKWHHGEAVFDQTAKTITQYIDGRKITGTLCSYSNCGSVSNGVLSYSGCSVTANHSVNTIIGSYSGTGEFFEGMIDDVKIYNYARTPAQIAWDYNLGKPVAEYSFNECQGNVAHDETENMNHGTITIGGTGTQDALGVCSDGDSGDAWYNGRVGKNNSAMSFDGTNDYINIGDPADGSLDFGSDNFSVSTWVKTTVDTSGSENVILRKDLNTASPRRFYQMVQTGGWSGQTDNTVYFMAYDSNISGNGDEVFTTSTINDGNWHHIVGVRSNSSLYIYFDGKLQDTETNEGRNVSNAGELKIGTTDELTNNFSGLLDDVKIFNYALTPLQIKTEFANGAASFR